MPKVSVAAFLAIKRIIAAAAFQGVVAAIALNDVGQPIARAIGVVDSQQREIQRSIGKGCRNGGLDRVAIHQIEFCVGRAQRERGAHRCAQSAAGKRDVHRAGFGGLERISPRRPAIGEFNQRGIVPQFRGDALLAFPNGIEFVAIGVVIGNARHKRVRSRYSKILRYHQAVVAAEPSGGCAHSHFLETFPHRSCPVKRALKQVFVKRQNICVHINGAGRAGPGKIFTRHRGRSRKIIPRRRHTLAGSIIAGTRVLEFVLAHHPGCMAIGGIIEKSVEGQNLLLRRADCACRQPIVEINAITRSLGGGIKARPVDQFEKQLLLVGRRCHRDTFWTSNFVCPNQYHRVFSIGLSRCLRF